MPEPSARFRPLLIALLGLACCRYAFASSGGDDESALMLLLAIQLGLLLFAAKLGGRLMRKLRLPDVLGEIAAGVLLGPYVLGSIGLPGFADGLFPFLPAQGGVPATIQGLSSIAAVVLLFHVGLETDLKLLMRYSVVGGIVGLGGMLSCFFLGAGTVMVFSKSLFGEPLGLFAPECLMLGTITTATSVSISARILAERHKLDSPEGVTILSAAVIDDVLGIIVLAIVLGVARASGEGGQVDWSEIAAIGGRAFGVWLLGTALGILAARRVSTLLKWFGDRTTIAIMALGLALLLAGLFEKAGLAMIIGAYVAGLALSRADISNVVRAQLQPIQALLVPVFFCTTGMRIQLDALGKPGVLVFGLVYAFVALGAKVFGCGLPALLTRFNLLGAARIGFGMAPRCEVALIIAGVGISSNLMNSELLSAVVIMVVVNTIVAPLAMVLSFRSKRSGLSKPGPGTRDAESLQVDFPTRDLADLFREKLVAVFEGDGFFVHRIHRENLFQMRQENVVIDLEQDGCQLELHCDKKQLPLIHAALHEALAAQEKALEELRKPLDGNKIREQVQQDEGPLGHSDFNLGRHISAALIVPELQAETKEAVIDELLAVLRSRGVLRDLDAARKAVWERESAMSTGLQFGVAIPHGRCDCVEKLVCAVGIKRKGLDFAAFDGKPSHIFLLTLSPRSKPSPHIQFMAAVSRALNSGGRERVLAAKDPAGIRAAFLQ